MHTNVSQSPFLSPLYLTQTLHIVLSFPLSFALTSFLPFSFFSLSIHLFPLSLPSPFISFSLFRFLILKSFPVWGINLKDNEGREGEGVDGGGGEGVDGWWSVCVCALSLDRKLNIRKHVHLQPPPKNNPTDMGAKHNASITFSPGSIFYMPNIATNDHQ